jgi:hypothetical protein
MNKIELVYQKNIHNQTNNSITIQDQIFLHKKITKDSTKLQSKLDYNKKNLQSQSSILDNNLQFQSNLLQIEMGENKNTLETPRRRKLRRVRDGNFETQ